MVSILYRQFGICARSSGNGERDHHVKELLEDFSPADQANASIEPL